MPLETHRVYEPWKHGHRRQGSQKKQQEHVTKKTLPICKMDQNGLQSKVPWQSLIDGVKAMMLPMLALAADVWIALLSCVYGCQCTEQMNVIVHRIGHQHLLRCWDGQPSSKDSSTLPLDNLPSDNLPKRTSLEEQTSLSTIMEMTSTSMLTSTAK